MALLLLIDGHSQAYRAFFGMKAPLSTREGEPTGAVYGFARKLLATLKEYKPAYVSVAFDTGDTWRHAEFPAYKATRDAMPDEMRTQMARIEQLLVQVLAGAGGGRLAGIGIGATGPVDRARFDFPAVVCGPRRRPFRAAGLGFCKTVIADIVGIDEAGDQDWLPIGIEIDGEAAATANIVHDFSIRLNRFSLGIQNGVENIIAPRFVGTLALTVPERVQVILGVNCQ